MDIKIKWRMLFCYLVSFKSVLFRSEFNSSCVLNKTLEFVTRNVSSLRAAEQDLLNMGILSFYLEEDPLESILVDLDFYERLFDPARDVSVEEAKLIGESKALLRAVVKDKHEIWGKMYVLDPAIRKSIQFLQDKEFLRNELKKIPNLRFIKDGKKTDLDLDAEVVDDQFENRLLRGLEEDDYFALGTKPGLKEFVRKRLNLGTFSLDCSDEMFLHMYLDTKLIERYFDQSKSLKLTDCLRKILCLPYAREIFIRISQNMVFFDFGQRIDPNTTHYWKYVSIINS